MVDMKVFIIVFLFAFDLSALYIGLHPKVSGFYRSYYINHDISTAYYLRFERLVH